MDQHHFAENRINQFCAAYKLDEVKMESIIRFTHGPVNLTRFNLVTKTLVGISKNVFRNDCGLGAPLDTIQFIEQLSKIEPVISEDSQKPWSQKGNSIPDNLIGQHPEYALLIQRENQPIDERLIHKWHLSWAVLVASRQYRELAHNYTFELNTSISRASLEIRKLDKDSNWPEQLPPLIKPKQSLDSYIERFEQYIDTVEPWGKEIYSLFKALKEQKARIRKSNREPNWQANTHVITDGSPELANTPKSIALIEARAKLKPEDIEHQGLTKEELATTRFFQINVKNQNQVSAGTTKNQTYRQRAKLNAIKSNNQLLLHSWSALSPHELQCLIKGLDTDLDLSNDLRGILYLLIWSGQPLSEIIDCHHGKLAHLQKRNSIHNTYWISDKKLLAVQTQSPVYKTVINQTLMRHHQVDGKPHQAKSYIFLELPPKATAALIELSQNKATKRIFTIDENDAIEQVTLFFKRLNKQSVCDLRLSINKVTLALSFALKAVGASYADILLITNHRFTHAERSLSYYHTTPRHLQSLHAKATAWMREYISGRKTSCAHESVSTSFAEHVVGAQFRLTRKLASMMTANILNQLNKARNQFYESRDQQRSACLIEFHNLLTYYTLKLFQFSSGYRAVNDPLEDINLIDAQTGFISISDKDDDAYRHSRIVQLPNRCLEQLHEYKLHLTNLSRYLSNPTLLSHLNLVFTHADQTRFGFLFYLDEAQNPIRAKADEMQQYAKHHLPNNIYRHFLRTELQNEGVSAEIISYFLGHWEIGEEPFQKFSTISPMEFGLEISKVTQALAIAMGWTVQRGVR
jgi:hypothetical protein